MNFRLLLISLGILCLWQQAYSQDETDLFEMSLEDLMNVEIVSASKEAENLFDTPVSSYSITREEIEKSGVTSIPEALRLCPGVIVREMTNGNYDIHLRGFDNVTRYANGTQVNFQTLLMVDNRPVFNYTYGAIIWEALPVDLIDVERIEVVRGPSAPLFGPNALTGVINIITRQPEQTGWYAKANAQYGTPQSLIGNVALGKKFNENTSLVVSGNYQDQLRHDDLYYLYNSDRYLENIHTLSEDDIQALPSEEARTLSKATILYPEPELALRKQGINAFFNHQVNDQINVNLSLGAHKAEVQREFLGGITSLDFSSTSSQYVNLASEIYGVNTKISYTQGNDRFSYDDSANIVLEFDSRIIDIAIEYPWEVSDRLKLRPSINYQSATNNDSDYLATAQYGGLLNRSVTTSGIAGSLRADYNLTDDWRLIGSVRADKFNKPDDVYVSYQFASTYTVSDKYLFRVAYAKSNSSAFALFTSTELNVNIDLGQSFGLPPGAGPQYRIAYLGNSNVDLLSVTMAEIGFRAKINEHLQIDIDAFRQEAENFSTYIVSEQTFQPTGLPEPFPPAVPATLVNSIENFPTTATQMGVTLSANFVPNTKLQFKPFLTVQKTDVENIPLGLNTLPTDPATNPFNIYNGFDDENLSTPRIYGGAFVHGVITPKLHANLSAYFFGDHTQFARDDINQTRNSIAGEIDSKLLLNTKVSYRIIDPLKVYVNIRNLLGTDSREYYGTDRIGRTIFVGASFSLN